MRSCSDPQPITVLNVSAYSELSIDQFLHYVLLPSIALFGPGSPHFLVEVRSDEQEPASGERQVAPESATDRWWVHTKTADAPLSLTVYITPIPLVRFVLLQ